MSRAADVLAILLVMLAISAGIALASVAQEPKSTAEFHQLVGGLGFGPARDLSRCEFSFDPRLCPCCSNDCGPIPGGMLFCPFHAGTLFDPSPLPIGEQEP